MNWKLIFELSLFGLAMAFGTVFVIPYNIEPAFWLPIFLICAYAIARQVPSGRFLHGLLVGVVNSVWVTGAHVLFAARYLASHAAEAAMMQSMPAPTHPRLMMGITGAVIGLVSGAVIGLLALAAGKFVKTASVPAKSSA